ncbi:protein of unknown function [uncultured Sphingopyxis sp.]|uniref:Uncharacterized protein n=1 Tax=uncultured Sphingopyxis sp. TaxID=310581 RepID=A0A1Y5PUM8_9SPHN|nr:protein of unknown function [uncultured Sphingopyxis sp.]
MAENGRKLPSLIRHPGLDPGSIHAAWKEWIPDQVRDDECLRPIDCGPLNIVIPAKAGTQLRPLLAGFPLSRE